MKKIALLVFKLGFISFFVGLSLFVGCTKPTHKPIPFTHNDSFPPNQADHFNGTYWVRKYLKYATFDSSINNYIINLRLIDSFNLYIYRKPFDNASGALYVRDNAREWQPPHLPTSDSSYYGYLKKYPDADNAELKFYDKDSLKIEHEIGHLGRQILNYWGRKIK
jgi:hypothetical protein